MCEHPTKGYVLLKRLTLVLDGLISGVAEKLITCIPIFCKVLHQPISLKSALIEKFTITINLNTIQNV